jgi:hypothetical protein
MKDNDDIGQSPSDQTQFVWGMRAIGQIAGGLNRDQVGYLIRIGKLKTRIVGRRHLTTVEQIHRDLLATGKRPAAYSKKEKTHPAGAGWVK